MVAVLGRKRFLCLLAGLLFLCWFFPPLAEAELPDPSRQLTEAVPPLGEIFEQGFQNIGRNLISLFLGELKTVAKNIPLMVAVLILFGIKNCMDFSASLNRTVSLGCFSATALLCGGMVSQLCAISEDVISHLAEFVYLSIPALTGLIANGGRVLSAAKSTYFILGFMDVIVFLIQKFFFPGVLLYFLCAVISALTEKDYFAALKKLLPSLTKTVLPLLVGIFVACLSVLTSVSKSSDELTVKTAKMALGTCVPFLGSVLTDSGEYLLQTLSQIKAQTGFVGIAGLGYLFVIPMLKLLAGLLMLKGLSVVACFLGVDTMSTFYDDVGNALGMLIGMTATVSVMGILALMILMGL